jgi:phosphatidylglycerol---prolipoprotein diacylglyceryl transferase
VIPYELTVGGVQLLPAKVHYIGSIPIDPWATLACLSFILGLEVARARGIRLGFKVRDIVDGAVFTVAMGLVVGHWVHVLAYNPHLMHGELVDGGEVSVQTGSTHTLQWESAFERDDAHLEVFRVDRNVVKVQELGAIEAGPQTFLWDGLDSLGNAAPEGTYHFRVEAVGHNAPEFEHDVTEPEELSFEAPSAAVSASVSIIRVIRQEVRTEELAGLTKGPASRVWDGRDDTGQAVKPGTYSFRIEGFRWDSALLELGRVWGGFSSNGGFLGAVAGCVFFYTRWRKKPFWDHADTIMFGFPFAWTVARLGCFIVHDHVGLPLAEVPFLAFAAVDFPQPLGPRIDLGLLEAIWTAGIAVLFIGLNRSARPAGFFTAVWCMTYAPIRFASDFLRNTDLSNADVRWLGLTPAQYGSICMFLAGLGVIAHLRKGRK